LDRAHFCDGFYFLGVSFDAVLENDEPKEHTPQDPENALLGVELDVVFSELFES
jgi:hypothetical protein